MVDAKMLKQNFQEAAKKSMNEGNDNTVYTTEMIYCLKVMADNDVWPDGNFEDNDCYVWSWFRK